MWMLVLLLFHAWALTRWLCERVEGAELDQLAFEATDSPTGRTPGLEVQVWG